MHGCKGCGVILPAVILIVTIWPALFSASVNFWIVIVAAGLMLIHSIGSSACKSGIRTTKPVVKRRARVKAKKKRK